MAWKKATGIGEASVVGVAHGALGWVAVGSTCADCNGSSAAAWFSTDGLTWSGGAIQDGADATLTTVATDGSTWFAAGVGNGRVGDEAGLVVARMWRSADGRTWSLVDSIVLGSCPSGCPSIGQLAATPRGVLLSWVQILEPGQPTMYWSLDGEAWSPVDEPSSGISPATLTYSSAVTVVDGRFVIVGGRCADCAAVWSSVDGRHWARDATIGATPGELDVATDGRRVVVVERTCLQECASGAWTSVDGRAGWARGSKDLRLTLPRVTYAANTFIVAGHSAPGGIGILTSPDGTDWTSVADQLSVASECGVAAIAGADDRVVLVVGGEGAGCFGIWASLAPVATIR